MLFHPQIIDVSDLTHTFKLTLLISNNIKPHINELKNENLLKKVNSIYQTTNIN